MKLSSLAGLPVVILGINAFHGDSAACLLVDGELVAAVEEERFTRVKHQAGFPSNAVRWCLESEGLELADVDRVAIGRDPRANLGRKLLYAVRRRPSPAWVRDRLANAGRIRDVGRLTAEAVGLERLPDGVELRHVEHHLAHAASAFLCSPFERAAVVSLDGMGDFASALWGVGEGTRIAVDGRAPFPHSLGILYTAITQYLGFWNYGDEYKVMGLAAYGEPELADELRRLVHLDGRFELAPQYFAHFREGVDMSWDSGAPTIGRLYTGALERLLGPARERGAAIEPRHEAVAASLQLVLEEAVFGLLRRLHAAYGIDAVCLAGGVALNAVANGKIRSETPFAEVYIQPAAYDAGTALGAALHVAHEELGLARGPVLEHVYLGPDFGESEIRAALERAGVAHERVGEEEAARRAADAIADGSIVGWYQGRMEFGPRALGNRSIVVDARRPEMKDVLNARIKRREPFRPFAPSILEEATGDYFEDSYPSPFMLMTYRVRPEKRDVIPAPTHVDGTGRLQTVTERQNPLYARLLREVEARTGVPVVLNTSFNENEPIVCTPAEAVACFTRADMDVLAIGPFVAGAP